MQQAGAVAQAARPWPSMPSDPETHWKLQSTQYLLSVSDKPVRWSMACTSMLRNVWQIVVATNQAVQVVGVGSFHGGLWRQGEIEAALGEFGAQQTYAHMQDLQCGHAHNKHGSHVSPQVIKS